MKTRGVYMLDFALVFIPTVPAWPEFKGGAGQLSLQTKATGLGRWLGDIVVLSNDL